jgi:hypothetical protein
MFIGLSFVKSPRKISGPEKAPIGRVSGKKWARNAVPSRAIFGACEDILSRRETNW